MLRVVLNSTRNLNASQSIPRRRTLSVSSSHKPINASFSYSALNRAKAAVVHKAPPVDLRDRIILPGIEDWRSLFKPVKSKDRVSVSNTDTATNLANAFVPNGSRDQVVIEAFPGPGTLTRALLALPKDRIKKLIVIENYEPYLEYLRPLAEMDPRVEIVSTDAFAWDTYQLIEDSGMLDGVEKLPWDGGLHQKLQFISHLPLAAMGEQFVAQTLRCIPEKSWLYKWGRVPINFILSEWVWSRMSVPLNDKNRCKLTVIAEATAKCEAVLRPSDLSPYDDHFFPQTSKMAYSTVVPDNKRVGVPFIAIRMKPLEYQAIGDGLLEKWDYCLRRLFVNKSTPLRKAISYLAPGAEVLIKSITKENLPEAEYVDVTKTIRKLTVNDWTAIVKAFDEWPFAPEDLMVSDAFSKDTRKGE